MRENTVHGMWWNVLSAQVCTDVSDADDRPLVDMLIRFCRVQPEKLNLWKFLVMGRFLQQLHHV